MNDRDSQFLALYTECRIDDQYRWYAARRAEFERASDQISALNIVLLVLAATAAFLASTDLGGLRALWSLLAVVFPVMSTALSAYDGLYAFDRQAKLYQDARGALLIAKARTPELRPFPSSVEFHAALGTYVTQVESIFENERGQWGQLMSEVKLADGE